MSNEVGLHFEWLAVIVIWHFRGALWTQSQRVDVFLAEALLEHLELFEVLVFLEVFDLVLHLSEDLINLNYLKQTINRLNTVIF